MTLTSWPIVCPELDSPATTSTLQSVQEIADTLEKEREVQFEEMLFTMNLNSSNIEQTYDNIMYDMFSNSINWG